MIARKLVEQPVAHDVVGRDLENGATHGDRLVLAALIAIREGHRAIQLDCFCTAAGLAHESGHLHPEPEVLRLGLEPLLSVLECSAHDGVRDTVALKVIAGEFVGSAHFVAIVFMQLSNVSPSDGANDAC